MNILLTIKKIISVSLVTLFFMFGVAIAVSGILMILDFNGIVNFPLDYGENIGMGYMYTGFGILWVAMMAYMTFGRKNKRKNDDEV